MLGTQVQSLVRKIRSHLLCGRKIKKKERKERKQQAWGPREKWENRGDPNVHSADEEARSKKNISNSLGIFLVCDFYVCFIDRIFCVTF